MRRHMILFFIMGSLYMNLEVVTRAIRAAEFMGSRLPNYTALIGWTSIWMFFIGGAIGSILGKFNEMEVFRKRPYAVSVISGTLLIYLIEFISGLIFNILFNMNLWDYSDLPLNLFGQISIVYLPVWFILTPLVFWIDDLARTIIYHNEVPDIKLLDYYSAIVLKHEYDRY